VLVRSAGAPVPGTVHVDPISVNSGGGSIMITRHIFQWLLVVGALIALPMNAYGQEATVSGTVSDSTGGVLPGVTITALHEASGNTFVLGVQVNAISKSGTNTPS
jgi:hypothetical protein